MTKTGRTKVILDTDIGDDIDDALALALICSLPELELVGVTTVFGNVVARARQAQTVLHHAGERFARVPVAAGCAGTMASRKVMVAQADPENVPGQASATLADERLPALDRRHGVEFLIETIMAGDGDIVPITIGAMTNLAVALTAEPRLVKRIPRIMSMAAEFQKPMAEWNIRCDPEAAHIVFSSGIPVEVITWSIGRTAMMTAADVERLGASVPPPRPMAKYLTAALAAWRAGMKQPGAMPSLYDPMAVAAIVQPELFVWQTGVVSVELRGEQTYGYTGFVQGEGRHKVAWQTQREKAVGWYLERIVGQHVQP